MGVRARARTYGGQERCLLHRELSLRVLHFELSFSMIRYLELIASQLVHGSDFLDVLRGMSTILTMDPTLALFAMPAKCLTDGVSPRSLFPQTQHAK